MGRFVVSPHLIRYSVDSIASEKRGLSITITRAFGV
jgi:hypothetical protein